MLPFTAKHYLTSLKAIFVIWSKAFHNSLAFVFGILLFDRSKLSVRMQKAILY